LPQKPAEDFQAQARAVLEAEVPIFSFTMGVPSRDLIAAFKARGTKVVGTATTVREAVVLSEAGVDAVAAQGSEAGAHRGTFLGSFEEAMISTLALVPQIQRAVSVPVIAAGGIMNGAGIRAVLTLGASAAMLGTAFLVCPEAGTAACYKAAVLAASGESTALTRAFSGRPARGIRNRFMAAADSKPGAVLPFPWQNAATRPLRAAAAKAGRADLLSLWAGQGAPLARAMPAAELVGTLVNEAGLEPAMAPRITT
jgi:nitronate monooxygenase